MGAQQVKGRAASIPGGLAIGAFVSMMVTILVAAVGANLVMKEILPQEQIGYCSIFALLSAGIIGPITASVKVKHRRLMVCLLSGFIYYLMLLSITALFFGGEYDGMGVTFITVILSAMIAALITSREGKVKNRPNRKKFRH
jgi:putative membrane protein (TIGR04086 family)